MTAREVAVELSRTGRDLFGEPDAAVLRALALQGRPVSGRETGRLAGVNQSSARRALDRWVKVGLVTAGASSHATLFQLNRAHVLWNAIEEILAAPARVEQAIGELVSSRLGARATVAVFGSVARVESEASSDVDIALIPPDEVDPTLMEALVDDLRELIETLTGNEAHIVEVTRQQLRDMVAQRDPLARAWVEEARTLAGPDLARLIAAAR